MNNSVQNWASVRVKDENDTIIIPISYNKPKIPDKIEAKWQKIVNMIARIMDVPTGLITRFTSENLEIFVASQTEGNPYKKDDKDKLGIGMFCETVLGSRKPMLVQNTNDTDYWRNNPHAVFGMRSYLGVPIQWEDGEFFGTFCMLNDKTNKFSQDYMDLIIQFKEIIETDLKFLTLYEDMKKMLSDKEMQIREIHHRTKNHFNLLISFIRLHSYENNSESEKNLLTELHGRIKTISLVHEKLYQSKENQAPMLDEYMKEVCDYIIHGFTIVKIDIEYDIEHVEVPLDISIPSALLILELVTNSLKHAFKDIEKPKITISIKHVDSEKMIIKYHDNGVGLTQEFDLEQVSSMGMRIIKALTEQLDGELEIDGSNGMSCSISMPFKIKD